MNLCILFADHLGELYKINLLQNHTHYVVPKGESLPYFSFADIAKKAVEGSYSENPIIRHASIANKWKTVHLIMYSGMNATVIHFNLSFHDQNDKEFKMQIFIDVDTTEEQKLNITPSLQEKRDIVSTTLTPEAEMLFEDIPEEDRFPKLKKEKPTEKQDEEIHIPYMNVSALPNGIQLALQDLDLKLINGDITWKGYNMSKLALLKQFGSIKPQTEQILYATKQGINLGHISENKAVSKKITFKSRELGHENGKSTTNKESQLKFSALGFMVSRLPGDIINQEPEIPKEDKFVQGRKLHSYQPVYEGSLPWEKRKYFKDLFDVSNNFWWHSHNSL